MPAKFLPVIVLFVACIAGSVTAKAADIRMDPSAGALSRAVLEGRIEAGDFEKVRTFLLHHNIVELYLASPGGNLGEAIRIGLMVRLLNLSTVVPSGELTSQSRNQIAERHALKDARSNYGCTSACFFVFIGGIHRSSDDHGPAILGIHEPFVAEDVVEKIGRVRAIRAEDQGRTIITNYLKAMDVPSKYAEDMYSVPKRMIRWIRNDEFESDLAGFITDLRSVVDAQCGRHTTEPEISCERSLQDSLAHTAYRKVIAQYDTIPEVKLSSSPRPSPPTNAATNSANSMPASVPGLAFPSQERGTAYPQPLHP